MGQSYEQLGLAERIEICRLRANGRSLREIAAGLGRHASTISRELRRNSVPTKAWQGGYDPARAQQLAERRRRWDCRFKLARQPGLRNLVRQRLAMGLSPEQIAGRLALEQARTIISHESIYRFIYHRSAQKDYWHRLLPRAKSRRGRFGQRGGSPADFIKNRIPLSQRPEHADDRKTPGHWEADLMAFSRYGQYLLCTHERTSRLITLQKLTGKTAAAVRDSLLSSFRKLPAPLRLSLSLDNGTEFAEHHALNRRLGLATYFCDPHMPWQKGGIENAIGRMRRHLPRKSNLASIQPEQLKSLVEQYNSTPRKCLAFQTPKEVFSNIKRVALQS
ncbi:MAG: IS30 family transposase [Parvibaculaceae bacterium]